MKNLLTQKVTAIILSGVLLAPISVMAQTEALVAPTIDPEISAPVVESAVSEPAAVEPTPNPVSDATPESETVVADDATQSAPEPAESVQDTANTQAMIESSVLEDTANPEAQPADELEVIEIVEATSTEETIEVVADPAVVETPVEEVLIEEPVLDVVAESLPPEPTPEPEPEVMGELVAAVVELKVDVDPAYMVSLSGKTIPAKKKGVLGTTNLTAPVATAVDGETGVLTVSGSCASPYFVVLIFKNQTDYEVDPRSFIVNRAYPCENGSYSYAIDRLPPTLPNGTYFLLIGEQGERGAWTPATGLTEIVINRSN